MLDLAVLQALNHLLAAAPWARAKLAPFAGKRARLVLGSFPLAFRIAPDGSFESLGTGGPPSRSSCPPARRWPCCRGRDARR
jgi:ubiquinone biosynthesis protein UbiJ